MKRVPVDSTVRNTAIPSRPKLIAQEKATPRIAHGDLGVELSRIRSSVKVSSYPLNFACGLARCLHHFLPRGQRQRAPLSERYFGKSEGQLGRALRSSASGTEL